MLPTLASSEAGVSETKKVTWMVPAALTKAGLSVTPPLPPMTSGGVRSITTFVEMAAGLPATSVALKATVAMPSLSEDPTR